MSDIAINSNGLIGEGSDVLIVLDDKKRWIVKVKSGKQFHCHKGYFDYDEIIGKPYGIRLLTSKSTPLTIYKPLPSDYLKNISHSSQILYSKDIGAILLNGGISSGSKVVETGTGSGALTSILATYVKPEGHVYSYEIRENAFKTATKNIEKLNLTPYVTLKHKDASLGFDEENVDAVVLDLGNPIEVIHHAYDVLRPSGLMSIFLPTYNQIEKIFEQLKLLNFGDITAIELIKREIQLKKNAIRPKTWMVGHTGFLIFARKMHKNNLER